MKKAILLSILLTSIVLTNIQSQDWKPFRLDRKSILTGAEDMPSRAIKFDSIEIQGNDTLYYHHNMFQLLDWQQASESGILGYYYWFSNPVKVQSDGNIVFFNARNDSLWTRFDLPVGEKYFAGAFLDGINIDYVDSVWATKTFEGTEDFLGVTDSVKTIIFDIVFYNSGNPYYDYPFHPVIKLSKNNGIITCFNIYSFPFWLNDEYFNFQITGTNNPILGIQEKPISQYLDMEVGDEFHFYENRAITYQDNVRIIYTILEENWSEDSSKVTYKIQECGNRMLNDNEGIYESTHILDTIESDYYLADFIWMLKSPHEAIPGLGENDFTEFYSQFLPDKTSKAVSFRASWEKFSRTNYIEG